MCNVFFVKQKTAYEMRIRDWSSDVCSSDLEGEDGADQRLVAERQVAAVVEVVAGQGAGSDDGRNRQQHGEARRLDPLEAEEAGGRHRDAGAAGAGNQRQDLRQADVEAGGEGHVLDAPEGKGAAGGGGKHESTDERR